MKTRRAVVRIIGSAPCGVIKVCTCALLALFLVGFLCVRAAYAAVWPVSESRLLPSLAFQDVYDVGSHTYKHYGIDIPSAAGSSICAPVSGKVTFVGRVPSGDSAVSGGGTGETMNAVSLKIQDGRTLTLMPFAQTCVSCGSDVSEGMQLGTLAASGDRSSKASHVHMGLKNGGVYYDPMSLFGVGSSTPVPVTQEAYAGSVEELELAPSSASDINVAEGVVLEDMALQDVSVPACEPALQAGTISSGNAVWQPKEDVHYATIFERVALACLSQFQDIQAEIEYLAFETGMPAAVAYTLAVVAMLGVLACIGFVFVRYCAPFVQHFCRRAITYLLRIWRGAIIPKLFPAWGTTFMSLSRQARRR